MTKFTTAQAPTTDAPGTLKQDAAFGPSVAAMVGTPLAAAAAHGLLLGLIVVIVAGLLIMWRAPTAEPRVWITAVGGALLLCLGDTLRLYPERHREVMDGWKKRETATEAADSDGDGWGAHPAMALKNNGSKPTDAVIEQTERAAFLAFVRVVEKYNTTRALAAMNWKDDALNTKYRMWLTEIVRMPDGQLAAEFYGKGQFRLRYPAEQIAPVIDKMVWTVDKTNQVANPRHN